MKEKGFLVETAKEAIKELEAISEQKRLPSQRLCLDLLYSMNPDQDVTSKMIQLYHTKDISDFIKKLAEDEEEAKKIHFVVGYCISSKTPYSKPKIDTFL